jgi:hypothetical protein
MSSTLIWVSAGLDDAGLTPVEFRILAHIARRSSSESGCWASAKSMAQVCGIGERNARTALGNLVRKGFLTRTERTGTTPIYVINEKELTATPAKSDYPPRQNSHRPPGKKGIDPPAKSDYPPYADFADKGTPIKVIQLREREREVVNRSEEAAAQSPALSPSNLKKEEEEALERRDRLGKELARIQSTRLLAETLLPFTRYFTLEGAYEDILPRLLVLTPSEVGALKVHLVSKSDRPNLSLAKVLSWYLQDREKGTVSSTLKPNQLPPRPRNGFNSVLN